MLVLTIIQSERFSSLFPPFSNAVYPCPSPLQITMLHLPYPKHCLNNQYANMPTPIVVRDLNRDKVPDPTRTRRVSTLTLHSHTQNGDISTSTRFLGYVFSFLSSAVSLASSIMFYIRGIYPVDFDDFDEWAAKRGINITENDADQLKDIYDQMDFSSKLFFTSGGIVTQNYQVFGSIAVSALLTGITMLVVFAHLDSYCFPNYFRQFFRDGSVSERNLIIALIVISAISLQICTSRFSIGEAQVNVFFSTWTTFGSSVLNFAVWRNSAGRHSVFQNVLYDREFPLKRHWFVLSIFTTITFLALIDYLLST